jgi:hypothetical protein
MKMHRLCEEYRRSLESEVAVEERRVREVLGLHQL